ncbi:hypothetical protein [Hornefia porci]|uniref:hypothetical protein n=1 Tax=Hornefia porci TaxID=2652292 RepID=UPI00117A45DC|nr:hypothetical protein [Hornefia porci]
MSSTNYVNENGIFRYFHAGKKIIKSGKRTPAAICGKGETDPARRFCGGKEVLVPHFRSLVPKLLKIKSRPSKIKKKITELSALPRSLVQGADSVEKGRRCGLLQTGELTAHQPAELI